jgi:hypothetical protein
VNKIEQKNKQQKGVVFGEDSERYNLVDQIQKREEEIID